MKMHFQINQGLLCEFTFQSILFMTLGPNNLFNFMDIYMLLDLKWWWEVSLQEVNSKVCF